MFIFALSIFRITQAASVDECRIMGDANALGLGIRTTIYLLHLSNFVTFFKARPKVAHHSLTFSNSILGGFQVAVIHSTFRNSLPQGMVIAILMILLLDIIVAFPIFFLAAIIREDLELSIGTALLILLRYCGTIAYNLWFWYSGLEVDNDRQCMEPRIFAFANLGTDGNDRTWFKILMTTLAVGTVLGIFIWMVKDIWKRMFHYRRDRRTLRWTYKMPSGASLVVRFACRELSRDEIQRRRRMLSVT
jgi:hypothetical protein